MVVEGAQVVVGDVNESEAVGYEVLCRHHRRRMTATTSGSAALSPDVLPVPQA